MKLYQNANFQEFNGKVVKCTLSGKLSYVEPFTNILKEEEFSTIGYAKCHKEDSFNLEKGKRIAESKASIKFYKKVRYFYNKNLFKKLRKFENEFNKDYSKVNRLIKNEENHLLKIKF